MGSKATAIGGAILVIAFMVLVPATTHAQSVWKYLSRVDGIASIYFYDIEGKATHQDLAFTGNFTSIGAGLGFNVPFYHIQPDLTLGINPNIIAAGVPGTKDEIGDRVPLTLSLEVPVYATIKYGTDASWHSESKVGLSAGIGMHYTGLTTMEPADISDSYIAPAVMAEVNFRVGSGLLKLRYSTLIGTQTMEVNGGGSANVRQQAFHLIWNFNS